MIKQRKSTDCGIATLANFLCTTYEDALDLYSGKDNGVTIQETAAILFGFGYSTVYIPLEKFNAATGMSIKTQDSSILSYLKHEAILQVLTKSGMIHQVYFDGKEIHDPAKNINNQTQLDEYACVDCLIVIKKTESLVRKKELS